MLVLRRTSPVRLSRTKWPRLVRRIWEPSLPVPVPVEGCGRVRDVFVVDDQEPAGGVLAVAGTSWRSRQGVVDPWMEPSPADPSPRRTPPPPAGRPARLGSQPQRRPVPLGQAAPDPVPLPGDERVGGAFANHRAAGTDCLGPCFAGVPGGPRSPLGEKNTALSTSRQAAHSRHGQSAHAPGSIEGPRPAVIARWIPETSRSEVWVPAHPSPAAGSQPGHLATQHRASETAAPDASFESLDL